MYMWGRLRTASRPSSTLMASVPYSSMAPSAPLPGVTGVMASFAVSRVDLAFPEPFRLVRGPFVIAEHRACSKAERGRARGATPRTVSRKKWCDAAALHLVEGG